MSVLMFKSVLTSLALLLAIGQSISGLRLRGYFKRVPVPLKPLRLWHRAVGDITLALTAVVGVLCVSKLGWALYTSRERAHAVLGILAGLAMVAKVLMGRRYRRYLKQALRIGAVAGFSLLGTFIFSALWYFLLIW